MVPADERAAIERHLAQIDLIQGSLKEVEADIAREAMSDPIIRRLMTLPGVDMTVASGVAAAVGDIRRFADPTRLVSYLGLNPSVRQSGEGSAYHGRITKQGRGQARGMLVEAAWAVARSPGPLRAFFQRVASRRGKHIAAVATARKLAMIIWHMLTKSTDYIWTRPALLARKFRSIELRAGLPTSHAKRGSAYDYNIPAKRAEERARVESAEKEYTRFTSRWRAKPRSRTQQGFRDIGLDIGLVYNIRVGRFAGSREVQRDAALVGPQVKITRHELAALIDADRCRESHFLAGPFQDRHDVAAAEGESWRQRRREAGEGIDDRKDAQLVSGRQLVMDEVHRPGLVRPRRRPAIIAQFGLDPALRRFVAQLQAQFAIDPPRLVLAMAPAFTTQQDVNTTITVADTNMADLLDLLFEGSLAGATGLVVVG
ncbi:hypothetical protein ABH992_003289 [Bradyrhizobium yuanmingense]|uniref:Transposase IS116/IS110/IS902 C-terminal domain-containing protein n=1 Tax=Bradyrhizobium yuanmingense TaxID=108015 RepID=A0ABV4GG16_9BRAD